MEKNPYLDLPYSPISDEIEATDLDVEGELPADLDGVYVRNGPNPRFAPEGRYHWFDGDGMLHAVRFAGGKASYRNRYVRTRAFERESEAGHGLWRGLMESPKHNPPDAPLKDTANTDLVFQSGSLLALWYLAGEPYRVDALTLETLGALELGHELGGSGNGGRRLDVSAHAKVDAESGELFFFDQSFRPPYLAYGVLDKSGALAHVAPIEVPAPRQPHDMAITERHAVLMDLPLFADPEALRLGRYKVGFHRDLPSRFAVLPRRGGGDEVRWFDAEPCYIYHVTNAWDEGDTVVMVGCRVENPEPAHADERTPLSRMLSFLRLDAQLHEWRFDLRTGQCAERQLGDDNIEFPAIAQSLHGRRSRYAYHVHLSSDDTLLFDGLFKHDLEGGDVERHWFGEGVYGSECAFAPRPGGEAEDDGYLTCFVYDARENQSTVQVFDAREVARGPIARVKLPQRVPLGFHATWVDGSEIRDAAAAAGGGSAEA